MEIGDFITITIEGQTREFSIIAIKESPNLPYTVYYLMNLGGDHRLYVRKGSVIPQETWDIKDHIIILEDEIRGDDYYFMVSVTYVLPL